MKKEPSNLSIAMLGQKRIPSREGGVEIVVEELAVRMVARGHKVTCYNRSGHHVSGGEFDRNVGSSYKGVRLINVPTIDRKGLAAVSAAFFAAVLAGLGKYDVVHFHAEGPATMCWIPKLFGKKVIVTVHGLDHQRAKWGRFASWFILTGEKSAIKYADEIVVLSKEVKKYFQDVYNRRTIYIPNGVSRVKQRKADEITKRWDLKKDEYVLFLGRLVPEKGIRYLIEAWKGIETEKKLVIAGGSSDTEEFQKELRANAGANVLFTGFVQGQLLEELYSNAYIYCLPSDLEGMPLSLLEAMSYGNCCLVSDIAECAEVVGDHAVLFQKSKTEDLREKLQFLLTNSEAVSNYKKQAENYICSKYNWEEVVDKTLALYVRPRQRGTLRSSRV